MRFEKIKDLIIVIILVVMMISFEYINRDQNETHASSEIKDDGQLLEDARFWGVHF